MAEQIEVIYACARRQFVHKVELKENDTFQTVIEKSGVLQVFPELELQALQIGSFGKNRKLRDQVTRYDRVEIYRPVTANPRNAVKK